MTRGIKFVLGLLFLGTQLGCASFVAARMPGPVRDQAVKPGMDRAEVEILLAQGAASEHDSGGRQVVRYDRSA